MGNNKFWLKIEMVILLLLMVADSFSQVNRDTAAFITNLPVKEGFIYYFQDNLSSYKDPAPYVTIYSKGNDVFTLMAGRVQKIFYVDSSDNILIRSNDTAVVYGNMDVIYKKVGDTVFKGELIGKIKMDSAYDKYRFIFGIIVGKRSMLYPDYINFLKNYQ